MEPTDTAARLTQKLASYKPSDETIALVRNTPILLLCGTSGAGKNSIKDELMKTGNYHYIVSHTTRPPRANDGVMERDGIEYHFITHEEAERMLDAGAYVEAKLYGTNIYGTSAAEVQYAHDTGKTVIADIEVQGVGEYIALKPGMKAIFIVPPNYDVWQERLKKRYGDTLNPIELEQRMQTALRELRHALEVPYFHFVVNDSLADAVTEIDEVARDTETAQEAEHARSVATEICRRLNGAAAV